METCRFLAPAWRRNAIVALRPAHSRFFAACRSLQKSQERQVSAKGDHGRRVALLEERLGLEHCYPRRPSTQSATTKSSPRTLLEASTLAATLEPGCSWGTDVDVPFEVYGRVTEVRELSSKLLFLQCEQRGISLQIVCNKGKLEESRELDAAFKTFRKVVRRGDWISASGWPYKTQNGSPAFLASAVPVLASPSLHQIPTSLEDAESKARKPHLAMLADPSVMYTLRLRSKIESALVRWFDGAGFHKVSTPILTHGAGGAIARPFETMATELSGTTLNLRIAPELWLKRLVLGGMDRIYELGPAFRNEGVDNTHNPEFTMCEFYWPFATLDELMSTTERILQNVCEQIWGVRSSQAMSLSAYDFREDTTYAEIMQGQYQCLAFVQTLEREMRTKLPDLAHANTRSELLHLFETRGLKVPEKATVPTLLDALCEEYIEPLCKNPTFITFHPAALSPLAKSFVCSETGQLVSARAELFIQGREYANMYEEENSPFEQRRKFEQQIIFRRDVDPEFAGQVDESYLEALEWGLPPTGGWGLGVDRLVMLLTGRQRIGDVLPFGTLRKVVGLQQVDKRKNKAH